MKLGEKLKNDQAVRNAAAEMVKALNEFVSYGHCRQGNAAERKMLAERFAELATKYRPLLARLGASPFVEATPQPYVFCNHPDFDKEEEEEPS